MNPHDITRSVIRDELDRVVDRLEQKIAQLRYLNNEVSEKRRFRPGPFDNTEVNKRRARIEAIRDLIEALKP